MLYQSVPLQRVDQRGGVAEKKKKNRLSAQEKDQKWIRVVKILEMTTACQHPEMVGEVCGGFV